MTASLHVWCIWKHPDHTGRVAVILSSLLVSYSTSMNMMYTNIGYDNILLVWITPWGWIFLFILFKRRPIQIQRYTLMHIWSRMQSCRFAFYSYHFQEFISMHSMPWDRVCHNSIPSVLPSRRQIMPIFDLFSLRWIRPQRNTSVLQYCVHVLTIII